MLCAVRLLPVWGSSPSIIMFRRHVFWFQTNHFFVGRYISAIFQMSVFAFDRYTLSFQCTYCNNYDWDYGSIDVFEWWFFARFRQPHWHVVFNISHVPAIYVDPWTCHVFKSCLLLKWTAGTASAIVLLTRVWSWWNSSFSPLSRIFLVRISASFTVFFKFCKPSLPVISDVFSLVILYHFHGGMIAVAIIK